MTGHNESNTLTWDGIADGVNVGICVLGLKVGNCVGNIDGFADGVNVGICVMRENDIEM